MGLREWFRRSRSGRVSVSGPSDDHPTAIEAIRSVLRAHAAAEDDGSWITFIGRSGSREAIIEVGADSLNFCTTAVDLPTIAAACGAHLAIAPTKDCTLWPLERFEPEALALVIDHVFVHVHGLAETCRVEGDRHA